MTALIFHIGYGKTGTAALQAVLFRNRAGLLGQGVLYPELASSLPKHAPLLPRLAGHQDTPYNRGWAGDADPAALSEAAWSVLLHDIAHHRPDIVILSDEAFLSAQTDTARMAASLSSVFDDIRLVAYVDTPANGFLRRSQQRLKARGFAPRARALPMRRQIENFLQRECWSLDLHAYDRAAFPQGDITAHFLQSCGLGHLRLAASDAVVEKNRGFSAEAMALAEDLGSRIVPADPAIRRKLWRRTGAAIAAADMAVPGYARPRLHDAAREYFDLSHPDLPWLRDRFGLAFGGIDYARAGNTGLTSPGDLSVRAICAVDEPRVGRLRDALSGGAGAIG